jgi:hypothetical protein
MAKISNQNAYPLINPTLEDYVVITDKDNQLLTKTTKLRNIQGLFELEPITVSMAVGGATGVGVPTFGNPVEIIPAPGPNKVLSVYSVFFYVEAGSIPYDYGGDIFFDVGDYDISNAGRNITRVGDENLNSTVNKAVQRLTSVTKEPQINAPLKMVVRNVSQDPTQGNGTFKILITYDIIDLALFDAL